jgi:hypothetical protein
MDKPALTDVIAPDGSGDFQVAFTVGNFSGTTAELIDIWVQVCDTCSFGAEPAGFEKPSGLDDRVRHRMIGSLNPGVSFEKMELLIKYPEPRGQYFQVAFRSSCKTCGGKVSTNQVATIFTGRLLKQPIPPVSLIPKPASQ